VRRDVGDAGEEVRGEAGQVAFRKLAGWEDLQNIGRLRGRKDRRVRDTAGPGLARNVLKWDVWRIFWELKGS